MDVKKIKIKLSNEDKYVKIPITLESDILGQTDLIKTNFVDIGVSDSINDIIDSDKISYEPQVNGNKINRLDYEVIFKNGINEFPDISYYGDIGFNDDDVKYKRNNFKKSFLNLMFFDSDMITNQNLISTIELQNRISRFDLVENDTNIIGGVAKSVNEIPIKYIIENPNKINGKFSDGYYMYYYNNLPTSLYMRSNYNNAKTGVSVDLITSNDVQNVNTIISKLHTKYNLKSDGGVYFYEIDTNYSNNMYSNGDHTTIKLYEINIT